jgi:hypothetical protein
MLEKATSLYEASLGVLYRVDGETIHLLALRGVSGAAGEMFEEPVAIEPGSSIGRLARGEGEVIHAPDVMDDEAYRSGVASRLKLVELTGARTALWDQWVYGSVGAVRRKPRALAAVVEDIGATEHEKANAEAKKRA